MKNRSKWKEGRAVAKPWVDKISLDLINRGWDKTGQYHKREKSI
ncbi:hypothetical protein [Lysinibacillus xylanilyticus]|nr:hypothetical protein [Lysinibacillus xylanilyticus]